MAEPAVANASPLIFLARGGHRDLLQLTGDRVLVPAPVAVEIRRRGSEDVTARALAYTPWLEIVCRLFVKRRRPIVELSGD